MKRLRSVTARGSWGQGGTGWRETKPRASRKTGFYFVRGQPRAAENIAPTVILEGSSMEAGKAIRKLQEPLSWVSQLIPRDVPRL